MKILIESIPHDEHRYPTVGDWFYRGKGKNKTLVIRVSELPDARMVEALELHELFEALACRHRGVTQKAVDQFDMKFEKDRAAGKVPETAEPGDWPGSPYATEHGIATAVERLYAVAVGLNWEKYSRAIEALP